MSELHILQPLPPFGHPEACKDYDEDCLEMTRDEHIACFTRNLGHGWFKPEDFEPVVGICPFMD